MTATGYTQTDTLFATKLAGGTAAGGDVTIWSTTNATKGKIRLGTTSVYDDANGRIGIGTTAPADALTVASSYAGGENTSDSTGRLHLESYQRAQMTNTNGDYASYGEVIRIYSRRWDSKQMVAWYGPTSYDVNGDPVGSDVTWFWMGAHYEANDHNSVHGHWSVEVPDSSGQMQTRMEIRIWDPQTGVFGMDKSIIHTVDADFVVSSGNGDLYVGGVAGTTRDMFWSSQDLLASTARRWGVQADATAEGGSNAGSDFRINRYSDSNAFITTALFINRSSGAVGIGNSVVTPGARVDVVESGARPAVRGQVTTTGTVSFAAFDGQIGAVGNRYANFQVIGEATTRLTVWGDGKLEWGDGTNSRDVNLYRPAADVLRTDDHLVVGGAIASVDTYANLPKGYNTSNSASIIVGSSYAGGDDDGVGTDSTGRINLYSYQRANVGSFGENIRNFAMRSDAKTMQAFYMPVVSASKKAGYDPVTRNPLAAGISWKPVVWQGAHFEANDHGSVHGHWELEIADSTGALQGRLEIPFVDQASTAAATDDLANVVVGVDYTNIRTNLADFSVRAQNITTGTYAGQNTALRVGGNNSVNKDVLLSISSDMSTSGRRWTIRANTDTESGSNAGTNLQILRHDDGGSQIASAIWIERASGNITLGAAGNAGARVAAKWGTSGTHGFSAQPTSSPGTAGAFDAQMTATTDRAFLVGVAGDVNRRYALYTDGKQEWGDGTNSRDLNLYRAAAGNLKTDQSLIVGTRAAVGTGLGADILTVFSDGSTSAAYLKNTADGVASTGVLRVETATTGKRAFDFRATGDGVSRLRIDCSAGSGSGTITFGNGTTADTNLYRSGTATLSTDSSFTVGSNFRHFGTGLGFFSAAAASKPTVTGSRGGNAALASLLSALATLGLLTDSSTA